MQGELTLLKKKKKKKQSHKKKKQSQKKRARTNNTKTRARVTRPPTLMSPAHMEMTSVSPSISPPNNMLVTGSTVMTPSQSTVMSPPQTITHSSNTPLWWNGGVPPCTVSPHPTSQYVNPGFASRKYVWYSPSFSHL